MKEYVYPSDYNESISFVEFLTLISLWWKQVEKELNEAVKNIESALFDIKINKIKVKANDNIAIIGRKITDNSFFFRDFLSIDFRAYYANNICINDDLERIISLFRNVDSFRFSSKFTINDTPFQVLIALPEFYYMMPSPKMAEIRVKSEQKIDIYYFNLENSRIYTNNNSKFVELPMNIQVSIFSLYLLSK